MGIWEQIIRTFVNINKESCLAYYKPVLETVMRKINTAKSLKLEELFPVGRAEIEKEKNYEKLMWRPESRDPAAKIIMYLKFRSKEMEQK